MSGFFFSGINPLISFPVPNQKSLCLAKLLVEEVVPLFGVPEALLSDRGANLLSHLMKEVCRLLGVKKLNTTAYHPQCDGMVERFNRTLKGMLRKHAARFGTQWDTYLHGVLWAYRNTPHESTGEKLSFLLYGHDCRSPTEAVLLPPSRIEPVDIGDYREEMLTALSEARELAVKSIRKAQQRYKKQYDKKTTPISLKVGDWVFVHFPHEETGKLRKLSRPWFGPYRICSRDGPDVTVIRVYHPGEPIQVHLLRVVPCPPHLPAGFYWYGAKCKSQDQPPKWVEALMQGKNTDQTSTSATEGHTDLGDSESNTTYTIAPTESDAECLTAPDTDCQDAGPQSTSSNEVDDGLQGPEDCGRVHHVVDSPTTQASATERRKVYPLRSRQRQARDELIGGEG